MIWHSWSQDVEVLGKYVSAGRTDLSQSKSARFQSANHMSHRYKYSYPSLISENDPLRID